MGISNASRYVRATGLIAGTVLLVLACGREGRVAGQPSLEPPSAAPAPRSRPTISPPAIPTDPPVPTLPDDSLPELRAEVALPATVAHCELPPLPEESVVRVTEAVPYRTVEGGELAIDIAHPTGTQLRPAVMVIHGGGWQAGERAHVRSMIELLATQGFVGVGVTYRLVIPPDGNLFPAAISDLRCAVRFLRVRASDFLIDARRIGVIGYSAGGHLAGLLATAADVSEWDHGCPYEASPAVTAAVTYFAPFDLGSNHYRRRPRRLIAELFGAGGTRADIAQASPITHVGAGDPPMLILHGTADHVVPITEARRMASRLRAAGVPRGRVEVPEGDHGFTLMSTGELHRPAVCSTWAFLRTMLQVDR